MVVGRGSAGMQALLEVADQGFRRCLVRVISAIRGNRRPIPTGRALIA